MSDFDWIKLQIETDLSSDERWALLEWLKVRMEREKARAKIRKAQFESADRTAGA